MSDNSSNQNGNNGLRRVLIHYQKEFWFYGLSGVRSPTHGALITLRDLWQIFWSSRQEFDEASRQVICHSSIHVAAPFGLNAAIESYDFLRSEITGWSVVAGDNLRQLESLRQTTENSLIRQRTQNSGLVVPDRAAIERLGVSA